MKLKSIPNLGTRTIHFPVIGDTKAENGIIDVADDKVKEFLACNCGYKFVSADGGSIGVNEAQATTSNSGDTTFVDANANAIEGGKKEEGEKYPKSALDAMRVQDLKGVAEDLADILTDEEKESFKVMKKQEMIEFLYGVLNSDRVEVSEEVEEEVVQDEEAGDKE